MGRGEIPLPSPSKTEAGRKAGPQVIGAGELSLPLPSGSTPETGPYTSPREHARAGPEGIGVKEQIFKK